jgi:hypothetical protein
MLFRTGVLHYHCHLVLDYMLVGQDLDTNLRTVLLSRILEALQPTAEMGRPHFNLDVIAGN